MIKSLFGYIWCSICLWLLVRKVKLLGWWYNLPSLKGYSDRQIIEGFKRFNKENK